jgi:hypothetical protein
MLRYCAVGACLVLCACASSSTSIQSLAANAYARKAEAMADALSSALNAGVVRLILLCAALTLGACAAGVPQNPVWIRADGLKIPSNPQFQTQFELDKIACEGAATQAHAQVPSSRSACRGSNDCLAAGIVDGIADGITRANVTIATTKACMADRGYLLVSEQEVEAKQEALRAAAAPPPPPPPSPKKR